MGCNDKGVESESHPINLMMTTVREFIKKKNYLYIYIIEYINYLT